MKRKNKILWKLENSKDKEKTEILLKVIKRIYDQNSEMQ